MVSGLKLEKKDNTIKNHMIKQKKAKCSLTYLFLKWVL